MDDNSLLTISKYLEIHKSREDGFASDIAKLLKKQKAEMLERLEIACGGIAIAKRATAPKEVTFTKMLSPSDANLLMPSGQADVDLMKVANKHIARISFRGVLLAIDEYERKIGLIQKDATGILGTLPEVATNGVRSALDQSYTQDYWRGIHTFTRFKLAMIIEQGINDNLPVPEVARQIEADESGLFTATRARRIARTETTAALNGGHFFVSNELIRHTEDTGVVGREWVALVGNVNTRPTHSAADGQRVIQVNGQFSAVSSNGTVLSQGREFVVGNGRARFPGDPTLPPEERINCRCTTVEVFED